MRVIVIFVIMAGITAGGLFMIGRQYLQVHDNLSDLEHRDALLTIMENRLIELKLKYESLEFDIDMLTEAEENQYQLVGDYIDMMEGMLDELDYTNDIAKWKILRRKFNDRYNWSMKSYRDLEKKIAQINR